MLPAFQLSPLTAANPDASYEDIISTACTFAMWQQSSGNGQAAVLTCDKLQLYFMQRQQQQQQQVGSNATASPVPQQPSSQTSTGNKNGRENSIEARNISSPYQQQQQQQRQQIVPTTNVLMSATTPPNASSLTCGADDTTSQSRPPMHAPLGNSADSAARSQRVRSALQVPSPREETREDVVASLANIFGFNAADVTAPSGSRQRRKRSRSITPGASPSFSSRSSSTTSTSSSSSSSSPATSSSASSPRSSRNFPGCESQPELNLQSSTPHAMVEGDVRGNQEYVMDQRIPIDLFAGGDVSEVLSLSPAHQKDEGKPIPEDKAHSPPFDFDARRSEGKRDRSPSSASASNNTRRSVHNDTAAAAIDDRGNNLSSQDDGPQPPLCKVHRVDDAHDAPLPPIHEEVVRRVHNDDDEIVVDSSLVAGDDHQQLASQDESFIVEVKEQRHYHNDSPPLQTRRRTPPPQHISSSSSIVPLPRRGGAAVGPPVLNTQRRALRAHKAGILSDSSWIASSLPLPVSPAVVAALAPRSPPPSPRSAALLSSDSMVLDVTETTQSSATTQQKASGVPSKRKTYQRPT